MPCSGNLEKSNGHSWNFPGSQPFIILFSQHASISGGVGQMIETRKRILNQVIVYFVITSAITAVIFIWMFHGAKNSMGAVFLMMWTPGIAAVLTSAIFKEKIGRYGWKPGRALFLGYGYLLPIVVSLVGYGLVWLSGYAEFTSRAVVHYRWAKMLGFALPTHFLIGLFSKMLLASIVAVPFVLGEEIGWSGFLTPKLAKLFSVPVTSLIVGGYWAAWHYPAIIGGFYGTGTPLWVALPGFTLVLAGASFLRTVLVERSGSLWPGVMVHVSHNVLLMGIFFEMTVRKGYAAYLVSETGVFLGLVYILVAAWFWKMQGNRKAGAA
jgi:membrane protease YdiL (CAAX protease family)